jgi:hypothetical protein
MFAAKRAHAGIKVRGYPKEIIGAPQLIPEAEYFGYLLVKEQPDRLLHVASGVTWYGAEVSAEPGSGEEHAKVPADEPRIKTHYEPTAPRGGMELPTLTVREAVARALAAGVRPGRGGTIPWGWCEEEIAKVCYVASSARGYGKRTLQKLVKEGNSAG